MQRKEKLRRLLALTLSLLLLPLLLSGCKKSEESEPETSGGFRIEYASDNVGVVEDPDEFQRMIDEAIENAEKSAIALEYKNDAFSDDGINFDCYIANSLENVYDMFIAIYGNAELTDELYLSQLLRPGQTFEKVKLNHALNKGENMVFVAFTQIEEVDGEQSICGQRVVTMNFFVN